MVKDYNLVEPDILSLIIDVLEDDEGQKEILELIGSVHPSVRELLRFLKDHDHLNLKGLCHAGIMTG